MFEKHSPRPSRFPAVTWRLASSLAFTAAMLLLVGACEDKGIGRQCSLGQPIPAEQGAYSVDAPDCQTHMCVKPPIQAGVAADLDTASYCSDTCTGDSDCQGGQGRDRGDPNDKRCKSGYTCAIPFGAADDTAGGGTLCCQKICLCRDFFLASVGVATPASCLPGASPSCSSK